MMAVLPRTLAVNVYVSLDGSGDFDGANDRLTRRVHYQRGVEITEGRNGVQQLNPPAIGAGGFDLRNEDGLANPDRPDSPYYQLLEEGKPVLYQATHGDEGVYDEDADYDEPLYYDGAAVFNLGRHVVDDLSIPTAFGSRRVPVETIGYETVMQRAPVTVALMTNPLVSECFTALLDAVSWPTDKRSIATSDTRLLYWWCDERNPWDAMLELLASEGPGTFGVDRDGIFYFENRNYRTTATRSTTSQATLADVDNGTDMYFTNMEYVRGAKNIKNRATYTTKRRTEGATQKIWEYGATLTLSANQTQTLFVRPSDPFTSAVAPVLATDYAVTSGSAVVTLTYTSGFLAIISIVAGGSGVVIDGVTSTGIQLRAKPLTSIADTTILSNVDASASIARYSPIPGQNIPLTLAIDGWPEIDTANAQAVCNAWVLRYMTPRPQVIFDIENADGEMLERILRSRVSDRLTLVNTFLGLSADVWINQDTLTISGAQGRMVRLKIGAEKCDTIEGAVWDVDLWNDPSALWGI